MRWDAIALKISPFASYKLLRFPSAPGALCNKQHGFTHLKAPLEGPPLALHVSPTTSREGGGWWLGIMRTHPASVKQEQYQERLMWGVWCTRWSGKQSVWDAESSAIVATQMRLCLWSEMCLLLGTKRTCNANGHACINGEPVQNTKCLHISRRVKFNGRDANALDSNTLDELEFDTWSQGSPPD